MIIVIVVVDVVVVVSCYCVFFVVVALACGYQLQNCSGVLDHKKTGVYVQYRSGR